MAALDEKNLSPSSILPPTSNSPSSQHPPRSQGPPTSTLASVQEGDVDPPKADFDPCENAKPCSPFYNHDTPRASMENCMLKPVVSVSVRDLEAQSQSGLTPSHTTDHPSNPVYAGTRKPWDTTAPCIRGRDKPSCLTKPKQSRGCLRLSDLRRRYRLMVKFLIGFLILGTIVGIGVGVSLRVGGGVYKTQNSTVKIGSV